MDYFYPSSSYSPFTQTYNPYTSYRRGGSPTSYGHYYDDYLQEEAEELARQRAMQERARAAAPRRPQAPGPRVPRQQQKRPVRRPQSAYNPFFSSMYPYGDSYYPHAEGGDDADERGYDWTKPPREDLHEEPARKSKVPVRSPSPPPPKVDPAEQAAREEAATKIQTFFRTSVKRRNALSSIKSVSSKFKELCESFRFPPTLDFDPTNPTMKLHYNSNNAPVHRFEDSLLKLLQSLDAVESGGNKMVREKRKDLVRRIEAKLAEVDGKKVELWNSRQALAPRSASGEAVGSGPGQASTDTNLINISKAIEVEDALLPKTDSQPSVP